MSHREFHVAIHGTDQQSGASEAPLRTISAAAALARPGDTVIVHAGIYREYVNPPRGGTGPDCRITYQAAPGERVEIRGSEIITGWENVRGSVWAVRIPNEFFGDFNPYKDLLRGHWFMDKKRPHHAGAVYFQGHWLAEAATLEELGQPHEGDPLWFALVDETHTVLHAEFPGGNPNENLVEINVRRTVFYPTREGCNFITVRGFVLSHAATPWAPPTTEQIGLIGSNWSKGWIIENNTVSYSICTGITLGKYHDPEDFPERDVVEFTEGEDTYHGTIRRALAHGWSMETVGGHIVRNNRISHCEMAGICGSFGAIGSQIEGNVIHDIHVRCLFFGFEMAGIKFHGAIDTQIVGNRIFRCFRGIWLDWMTQGTRVSKNLCYDNGPEHDLFTEVNHGPFTIDNNLFLSKASLSSWSEGGAYLHNLFYGRVDAQSELGRVTPFHKPHSTQVAGWKNISQGDDHYVQNIFAEEKGLSDYDKALSPVHVGNNLYLRGAKPSVHDQEAEVRSEPVSLEVEDRGEEVFVKFVGEWPSLPAPVVSSPQLGVTRTCGLGFENPDGSAFQVTSCYDRSVSQDGQIGPFPGPMTGLRKVWPRSA